MTMVILIRQTNHAAVVFVLFFVIKKYFANFNPFARWNNRCPHLQTSLDLTVHHLQPRNTAQCAQYTKGVKSLGNLDKIAMGAFCSHMEFLANSAG